jgi:CDP-diglyceride synthetase
MPKKPIALIFFYVLNILLYGSILVFCGIWPVVELAIHPSDMPMGLFLTVFAVAIFAFAFICGWPTYFSLNSVMNHANAWLWTLVALFVAPFASVASAFLATKLFPATGYFLYSLPLGFALPFFVVVGLGRMNSRNSLPSQQNNLP